jgi:hypothetical protein
MPRFVSRASLLRSNSSQLLHADEQAALWGGGIAGAGRVVDRDADLAQISLEERGGEAISSQAGSRIKTTAPNLRVVRSCAS